MRAAPEKNTVVLLIIFLILGIVAGGVIAQLLSPYTWANFLTYTRTFALGDPQPLTLDLSVFKISFGIGFRINLAEAICILFSVLAYRKWH